MKKIEVLAWGVKHIAANHRNVVCNTEYEECRSMSIADDAVPTLSDARMLCEDLGIARENCYADHSWGVIVIDLEDWLDEHAQEEYVPTGLEMWHTHGVEIGSPIEKSVIEQHEVAAETETAFVPTGNIYEDLPY